MLFNNTHPRPAVLPLGKTNTCKQPCLTETSGKKIKSTPVTPFQLSKSPSLVIRANFEDHLPKVHHRQSFNFHHSPFKTNVPSHIGRTLYVFPSQLILHHKRPFEVSLKEKPESILAKPCRIIQDELDTSSCSSIVPKDSWIQRHALIVQTNLLVSDASFHPHAEE